MAKRTTLPAREFSGMTDIPSANKSLPGYLLPVSAMGRCILRITNPGGPLPDKKARVADAAIAGNATNLPKPGF